MIEYILVLLSFGSLSKKERVILWNKIGFGILLCEKIKNYQPDKQKTGSSLFFQYSICFLWIHVLIWHIYLWLSHIHIKFARNSLFHQITRTNGRTRIKLDHFILGQWTFFFAQIKLLCCAPSTCYITSL